MILILSKKNEITTNEVTKWLVSMKKKFIRVNEDEIFEISVIKKQIQLASNRNQFFLNDITSVWYRKGELRFENLTFENKAINQHMSEVQYWLQDFVLKTLENKKTINKQSNASVNKLLVLQKAKDIGLKVPEYFLATNTNDVVLNKTITKSISEDLYLSNIFENTDALSYTKVVQKLNKNNFYPSFFQEKIEKDFEIRSFYLNGKIWSIAIFSQNSEQTKVDYRNYNKVKPNRNISYNLPKNIEEKINLLMKSFDLNCGSLDFMKNGNDFYFLEINPVGQFIGLSQQCNYNLDKEIANYL
jgi:ATP-GRASP peptide maturase of grasp-with-spasm system